MSRRTKTATGQDGQGATGAGRCEALATVAAMMAYLSEEVTQASPLAGMLLATARLVVQSELDAARFPPEVA